MKTLEKVYDNDSPEYARIQAAGLLIKALTHGKFYGEPHKTYFDIGQDWIYTALIVHDSTKDIKDITGSFQVNPASYEAIVGGTLDDITVAVKNILEYPTIKGNY